MQKFLKILIPVIVFGGIGYYFRAPIKDMLFPLVPCTEPIPYALGTFDTKFNISQKYFLSALSEAEAIWEKPYGKELFNYVPKISPKDTLKVNLIYDYRQEATSKLASLGIVVENTRASYDTLKAKFETLKVQYEKDKNLFNARVGAFNQKELAYEEDVNYWNKKGGAPEGEYQKLQATQATLQNESQQLQNMQRDINNEASEINALIVVLNRLVDSLNLSVVKFNTTNTARGETFEEGVYSSDGSNKEIDIYEFSNRDKLVRVLAHELGHALGLNHVADPKAIMYELNQGNNKTLTEADLDALKTKCGTK